MVGRRHVRLPDKGRLMISTDVHGNGEDFRRLETLFRAHCATGDDWYWVILGDVVHAPDTRSRMSNPRLYDYDDESAFIVERIASLREELPERVLFVLGNHDYAHIGGLRTSKFHPDEAAFVESRMSDEQVATTHGLFQEALLAVSAPCGVLLTHGSPDRSLRSLDDLDDFTLPPAPGDTYQRSVLNGLLYAYGQRGEVTADLLGQISTEQSRLYVVVHGHDRDLHGVFREGGNQLCAVIFGAYREEKRYVELDLSARYESADALRDDIEVKRLYAGH